MEPCTSSVKNGEIKMKNTNEILMAREIGTLTDIHRQGGEANTKGNIIGLYQTKKHFVCSSFGTNIVDTLVEKGYLCRYEHVWGYSVVLSGKGLAAMARLGY